MPPELRRGVNVVFWLAHELPAGALTDFGFDLGTDTPEGRAAFFGEEHVARLAADGFDHVRVLFEPHESLDSGYAQIDQMVRWTEASGMGLVLSAWSLPGHAFTSPENPLFDEESLQAQAEALWRGLARRYEGRHDRMWFDLLNEPRPRDPRAWNRLFARLRASGVPLARPRRRSRPDAAPDLHPGVGRDPGLPHREGRRIRKANGAQPVVWGVRCERLRRRDVAQPLLRGRDPAPRTSRHRLGRHGLPWDVQRGGPRRDASRLGPGGAGTTLAGRRHG